MAGGKIALVLVLLSALALLAAGCGAMGTPEATQSTSPGEPATSETSTTEIPLVTPAVPAGTGGSLLGKWHNATTGETLEFRADGTVLGTAGDQAGLMVTYTTEGNVLTIDAAGGLLTSVYYSVDGDTLTLTDPVTGEPGTLKRID
jgi:hypothetical protein